ncbi:MAG: hypothetical protein QNI87_05980 [Erythrobacter sp.]|uniref:hypothetical protein n=1 Tax=Erythrobacter sp. TaxID=1042 RepID=UPI00262537EA|nr:hypothetical protein [Erythrobacter sp.]MDJ0978063.1 hypothetical protein [Erythrobacter sp.]
MARSIAIIGAGQIGYAAAREFLLSDWRDWDVRVLARTEPAWSLEDVEFERYVAGEDPAPEADAVLDTIAFDADDVARYDPDRVGRYIAMSSAAVYRDPEGRSFDTAAITGYPDFGHPIPEDASTIAGGPQSYSTKKVRMERKARELFQERSTVLRPCAIYGPYSRHPREWWFVNRIKDRRRVIPLAFDGESVFHTTSARSIGAFAAHAADLDIGGVFNVADANAPSVREIGQAIAAQFGKRIRFYGIEGPPVGSVGATPWSVPAPFEVDCSKAFQAGFDDFADYRVEVAETVNWLRGLPSDQWQTLFPQLAAYPREHFDYEAEDRFFASL